MKCRLKRMPLRLWLTFRITLAMAKMLLKTDLKFTPRIQKRNGWKVRATGLYQDRKRERFKTAKIDMTMDVRLSRRVTFFIYIFGQEGMETSVWAHTLIELLPNLEQNHDNNMSPGFDAGVIRSDIDKVNAQLKLLWI